MDNIKEVREDEGTFAATFNRKSEFQNSRITITVTMEWNEEEFGYIVNVKCSDSQDKNETPAMGYIQAYEEYVKYCKLSFEEAFQVKQVEDLNQ